MIIIALAALSISIAALPWPVKSESHPLPDQRRVTAARVAGLHARHAVRQMALVHTVALEFDG